MSTIKPARFSLKKKETLQRRKGIAPWLVLVGMLSAVALWLFPIYIAVINAFKPEKEYSYMFHTFYNNLNIKYEVRV